ncbi:MAG: hypothetical protein ACTSQY_10155, partial [Candidatus Odinarchaeia archaeon]
KATRALNSAVKLRRFLVISVSPEKPILHLSHLSSFWGAPQFSPAEIEIRLVPLINSTLIDNLKYDS